MWIYRTCISEVKLGCKDTHACVYLHTLVHLCSSCLLVFAAHFQQCFKWFCSLCSFTQSFGFLCKHTSVAVITDTYNTPIVCCIFLPLCVFLTSSFFIVMSLECNVSRLTVLILAFPVSVFVTYMLSCVWTWLFMLRQLPSWFRGRASALCG